MTNVKFNNHDPVKRVIKYDILYNIGLCHGLAPNPWGFTFEGTGDRQRDLKISGLLQDIELNDDMTLRLINYIRGEYKC